METENEDKMEYGIYRLSGVGTDFGFFEGFEGDVLRYAKEIGATNCYKLTVYRVHPDSVEMRKAVLEKQRALQAELSKNFSALECHDFSSVRSEVVQAMLPSIDTLRNS